MGSNNVLKIELKKNRVANNIDKQRDSVCSVFTQPENFQTAMQAKIYVE
jgi:hypothetical protein